MTKRLASYCSTCACFLDSECLQHHHPRNYKGEGVKRVCADFLPYAKPKKAGFFTILFNTLFGAKR